MEPKSELHGRVDLGTDVDANRNIFYNSKISSGFSCDGSLNVHRFSRPEYEDRFLVDRKKLELIIMGSHDCADSAEDFFNSIMEETNTMIDWPHRLKVGAKSRKDPYVRVSGKPTDLKEAKEKVLAVLGPKRSQVIMKLDICYTDHSHIIGKGGQTIQRVMEETGCHIHFPDSNRSSPVEKSNQVSITGNIEGVEQARQQLRMLSPVKFSFELSAISPLNDSAHPVSQIVEMVQERYNVRVILRKGPKLFSSIILVKGSEAELVKTETATRVLMQHLCNSSEGEVPVQMTMEISPQHISTVRGFNNCNLKEIMVQTSTIIIFPDAVDPNLPPFKKSTVTITGSIHNAYLARQRLVGSLPLVLMFNVGEEHNIGIEHCNKIMQLLDVVISVRLKPKYGSFSVHIKGLERNTDNIYKARQMLLNSCEPAVHAVIPQSYFGPSPLTKSAGTALQKAQCEVDQSLASPSIHLPLTKLSFNSLEWRLSSNTQSHSPLTTTYNCDKLDSLTSSLVCKLGSPEQDSFKGLSFGTGLLHLAIDTSTLSDSYSHEDNSPGSSNVSTTSSLVRSPMASPRSGSTSLQGIDSGYGETCESESSRPMCGVSMVEHEQSVNELGDEYCQAHYSDYDNKQTMAMKAMQDEPDASKLRVPHSKWSGFGFSHSMPRSMLKSCKLQSQLENTQEVGSGREQGTQKALPFENSSSKICTSSYLPSMTTDGAVCSVKITDDLKDLFSLLRGIGMARYSYMFTSQEIDMVTFMTLDDNDLRLLGIPTYVARQKILWAISEMRKKYYFNGGAPPDAERKPKKSFL